jgi:hypothetical protein
MFRMIYQFTQSGTVHAAESDNRFSRCAKDELHCFLAGHEGHRRNIRYDLH